MVVALNLQGPVWLTVPLAAGFGVCHGLMASEGIPAQFQAAAGLLMLALHLRHGLV